MFITTETGKDDEQGIFLRLAQQGDGEAFCRLAEAHQQRLLRQAAALCGSVHEAEDLVAETMIEAWRSLKRFDHACRFSTWLYAILLHRHQKSVRRKQSRPVPLSSLPFNEANAEESILVGLRDSNPNASESLARRELAVLIKSAVALLPEHHQAVVLLRFYGDASLSEIAAALGVPEGTVKSRLHHALETLRNTPALVNLLSNLGDI